MPPRIDGLTCLIAKRRCASARMEAMPNIGAVTSLLPVPISVLADSVPSLPVDPICPGWKTCHWG